MLFITTRWPFTMHVELHVIRHDRQLYLRTPQKTGVGIYFVQLIGMIRFSHSRPFKNETISLKKGSMAKKTGTGENPCTHSESMIRLK